ncbi:hypothetical protein PF010_g30397 [Phytophthora fragariae]|uniref:Uncharacterized protein n=1 Tax=Phytophthora fragariae TaxID=53985 RepID=A0A6G0JKF3_9STRA|nr:hypothetical protein PF010_g30397 [Phytophthora fragariae]
MDSMLEGCEGTVQYLQSSTIEPKQANQWPAPRSSDDWHWGDPSQKEKTIPKNPWGVISRSYKLRQSAQLTFSRLRMSLESP